MTRNLSFIVGSLAALMTAGCAATPPLRPLSRRVSRASVAPLAARNITAAACMSCLRCPTASSGFRIPSHHGM